MIGSGPGGYTAAFRAADLGLKTVLIERYETLGGVCLNVGCIPSKALLHAARVIAEAEEMAEHGIKFGKPKIDLDALRAWKESVVGRLTGGLAGLAKQRKVEVVTGVAKLTGPNTVTVGDRTVSFDNCIIAAGSEAASLPGLPDDERIIDSTGALELPAVPKRLLVIGGGIIGLEMATVYDALGSKVTVVELLDQLIPGCDPDLVKPLHKRISARYEGIHLGTKVESVEASEKHLEVTLSSGDAHKFDGILVAVGRRPNGRAIGAAAGRRQRRRRRLHPGRPPAAHQRAGDLRDRRRGRRPDARPQGLARGQGRRRGDRGRARRRVRPPRRSRRSPTPTPRSPGWA